MALSLLTCGCIRIVEREDKFAKAMDANIGTLSYDDAITAWGPPSSVAEGEKVIAASWKENHNTSTLFLRSGDTVTALHNNHKEELMIIFDKETKRMTRWSYQVR